MADDNPSIRVSDGKVQMMATLGAGMDRVVPAIVDRPADHAMMRAYKPQHSSGVPGLVLSP